MENKHTYTVVILEDPIPYHPTKPKIMKMVRSFWTLEEARDMQKEMKEKTVVMATY